MNILEQSETLKDIPEQVLIKEMQMPSGSFPQYLVLTEIKRRKRIRDDFQRRQAQDVPTVAEEAVTAAGVPQEGIMQMAKAMAPKTNMGQNTGMANMMPKQPVMGMNQGGIIEMQTGGLLSAIANLKVNHPEVYAQYAEAYGENSPELNQVATAAMRVAREPEMSGIESLETDMTDQAAPFEPTMTQFTMDTSGETRPIGPEGTMFNVPIGQVQELFREPFIRSPGRLSAPAGGLQYEPAKPGEYYYKGNAFILDAEGNMVERISGVPVTDSTKAKILAANLAQVPIEGYGESPTDNRADPFKLRSDFKEGTPVEFLDDTKNYSFPRKAEAYGIEGDMADLPAPLDRLPSGGAAPSQVEMPSLSSLLTPTATDSASIAGSRTTDFSLEPGSPAETDAIREFLARERGPSSLMQLMELMDSNPDRSIKDLQDVDVSGTRLAEDPIGELLNKRAQEYLQSDLSTPKEEVYSELLGGDPRETAKYQEATQEERDRISDDIYQNMLERDRLKEKRLDYLLAPMEKELQDRRTDKIIDSKITGDNTFPVPDSLGKSFIDAGADLVETIGGVVSNAAEKGADMAIGSKADKSSEVVLGAGAEFTDPRLTEKGREIAQRKAAEDVAKVIEDANKNAASISSRGSASAGSLESRIAKAIADREKRAESDKWLALAQTGLIMASGDPADLKTAGQAGLKALTTARAQKDKFDADMLGLQQRIDAYKARIAAAASKSGITSNQMLQRGTDLVKQGQDIMLNAGGNADTAAQGQDLVNYGNALINAAMGKTGQSTSSGSKTVKISGP